MGLFGKIFGKEKKNKDISDSGSCRDESARQLVFENIEKYGCHLVLIEPDNYLPGFVYSIGLFKKFGHPEIICFGMKTDLMARIINHACDLIKQGEVLVSNKSYSGFLQDFDIQFLQVDKNYFPDYLGYGGWINNNSFDFPALQLVWPDKQHKFPWEEAFNPDWKFKQPLLDRNIDFKFYEARNLAVFTTKDAFKGAPILFASHNNDGDWQFHTSSEPKLEEAMIVCMEEITKLDPTVNELHNLKYGWRAWRTNKESEWQYSQDDDKEESQNPQ